MRRWKYHDQEDDEKTHGGKLADHAEYQFVGALYLLQVVDSLGIKSGLNGLQGFGQSVRSLAGGFFGFIADLFDGELGGTELFLELQDCQM